MGEEKEKRMQECVINKRTREKWREKDKERMWSGMTQIDVTRHQLFTHKQLLRISK